MVKLLQATQKDLEQDATDTILTAAEEAMARSKFASTGTPGDLSDGGVVNGVRITPMIGGRPTSSGRPAAREAWKCDGSWTVLTLAWNPDGTRHDGARPYLLKNHCECCNAAGFRARQCPACVKSNCTRCRGGTAPGKLHRNFYLRREDVPHPVNVYGDVACFLPECIRRGVIGFKTQEEMRFHARSRHKMQYQAHMETLAEAKTSELTSLRERLDALTRVAPVSIQTEPVHSRKETSEAVKERMARARAARKAKAATAVPAIQ